MTGVFLLDWAIMAISLANVILLIWLGLTVLLNAERQPIRQLPECAQNRAWRRHWGIWIAGGGMLMGGLFFVSHSALLGHGLYYASKGMNVWWHVGWVPVVALPFAWYAVMLWYAGFWDDRKTPLHRRHRPWFLLNAVLAGVLIALLIFATPLPSYLQVAQLRLSATPSIGNVPLMILVYPVYVVLCIALSLDALRRPGPSARTMGDRARRRARPWLMAASGALLIVSLLVTWVMLWVVLNAHQRSPGRIYTDMALTVAWFDLAICALIAVAVVLLGQAIVSYEVFTGKTLPRRGLLRYWHRAVILAAGYGVVVGWSLVSQLRAIYSLLLTTLLMVAFYALLTWRSYAQRERYIKRLRPFVASQQLYEQLLTSSTPPDIAAIDTETPFRALCEDVLNADVAYLVALGPLAPLVGPALVHPDGSPVPSVSLAEITAQFDSPQTMCASVDPAQHGGATWAVPLWSERGLIGALLLGEKRDGGVYTQEEIEIARTTGERLIDTQASAEMARRLMALQRQRLAESQVLDQQARRALHDDILPSLHAATLTLSGEHKFSETVSLLTDVHRQISDLLREMPTTTAPQVKRLGLLGALRQIVHDEFKNAFDEVTWQIGPEAERQSEAIAPLTAEVLFYAAREAIRNAALHGRSHQGERPLHLTIRMTWRDELEVTIEDDGVGMAAAQTSGEGSGQGLALHSTMMAVVGGALAVESEQGAYTRVSLTLPMVSTQR